MSPLWRASAVTVLALEENEVGIAERTGDQEEVHSYRMKQQPGQEPHKGEIQSPHL